MKSPERLIVFAKAPRPGFVKTRLADAIGSVAACQVYKALLNQLCSQLAGLQAVEFRHSPDDAAAELEAWKRPGWTLAPQGDGDLGARLTRAFAAAFADGARRVVVIGSDCPGVSGDDIREAWQCLESVDVVLGPAEDGGYWLVGLRGNQPQLFEGIPWGGPDVARITRAHVAATGLSLQLLCERWDVDTEADWNRYRQRRPDLGVG